MKETIFVTGDKGMIGSQLVKGLLNAGYVVVGIDRSSETSCGGDYFHYMCELEDVERLRIIFENHRVDRIIHLAALAHTANEADLSWERYFHVNVECAGNIFAIAGERPVLFISTVDVFGFFHGGTVSVQTPPKPVTAYGKSKKMAEEACGKLPHYTIFRFSPVYTPGIKRDIQKRYYLSYPGVAYRIGKGTAYEILNIDKAVSSMVDWCAQEPKKDVRIIKDDQPMWTPDCIRAEKSEGRARVVLKFPRWMVNCGYLVLKGLTGENKYTYLLNKAVHPLKTE